MVNPNDIAIETTAAGVVGNHGGRPPDSVITLDGSTALERPYSPSVTEIQPSTKKGRCMGNAIATGGFNAKDQEGDLDMNLEDGISDSMELIEGTIPSKTDNQNVNFGSEWGSLPDAPSFKDKLLGSAGVLRNLASLSELDVDVKEEDVRIGGKVDHRSRFDVLADVPDNNGIGTEPTLQEAPNLPQVRNSLKYISVVQRVQLVSSLSRNHPCRQEVEWRIWQRLLQVKLVLNKFWVELASSEKVVMAKSTLSDDKNVAVQVLEPSMLSGSKEVRGRILPSSLKGGSSRVNSKAQGVNLSIK
ncbi:hypothetical protein V6N12_068610 [Hibiscus sabdariffa]|uniref:Uncharacterized protein n=1 Tax=Hibiscus sabdariffa TaxID=183260 RepID=A0ABR2FQI1_9ROSI